MSGTTSVDSDRSTIDAEHLRLLAIFHFVSAGLALCGLLFIAGHFALFHAFFSHPEIWQNSKQGPPPAVILNLFLWFYGVFAIWFGVTGAANLLSGLFLRARRHRVFSMVVAGLNCLYLPLGTILAVFTFIVLTRSSVVSMYEA